MIYPMLTCSKSSIFMDNKFIPVVSPLKKAAMSIGEYSKTVSL